MCMWMYLFVYECLEVANGSGFGGLVGVDVCGWMGVGVNMYILVCL